MSEFDCGWVQDEDYDESACEEENKKKDINNKICFGSIDGTKLSIVDFLDASYQVKGENDTKQNVRVPITELPFPKWISVNDKLPDRQEPVLVYVPPYTDLDEEYTGYVGMAYYTYSARGGFWAGTDGNLYGVIGIIHKPTHWMPLPEPPELLKREH